MEELFRAAPAFRGSVTEDYEFVNYNVWQPVENEVLQDPLALLDARTLKPQDLSHYVSPGMNEKTGGATIVSGSPRHRWYYFSKMRTDEALVFMGHSLKHPVATTSGTAEPGPPRPSGVGREVAHTSFNDPTAAKDVARRKSIETRVLAVFRKKKLKAARL